VRADHPLALRNEVDLEALVSIPHVAISRNLPGLVDGRDQRTFVSQASWEDSGAFAAALAAAGLTRRVGVTVPDSYAALAIAGRSDMTALIPRRLALLSAQSGRIKLIDPPYESPSVDITLLYLKERLAEPAIAWMRDLIRAAASSLVE
jgi:DNA-binding transcriptional LysR family regulator